MCKSFEMSLWTGIYSYAIAYYLYHRNLNFDRAAALILVTFSTIQWLEALLWYGLTNPTINKLATALIPVVLGLEFVSTLYAASMHSTISTFEILIYVLSFFTLLIMWWRTSTGITTIDPSTGSLLWGGIGIDPIMRFAFLALLLYPLLRFIPASTSITLIALVTTFFFFYSFRFGDTFGSNWCWIANLVGLIQLYAPIIGS